MRRFIALAILFGAALSIPLGLAGCGGGSSISKISAASGGTGRATITLKWPARSTSRVIPVASNRVVVTLKRGSSIYGSPVIFDRPSSGSFVVSQTVNNLPVGSFTADAVAYPDTNSASVVQAKVLNQAFSIANGQTVNVSLTLASAISTIVVSGTDNLHSIVPHAILQLSAVAKDANNDTVLTSSNLVYSSSNTSAATVNPATGLITTLAAGNTIITVTDTESGVQTTYSLAVPAAWPNVLYTQDGTDSLFGVDDFSGANWKNYNASRGSNAAIADVRGIARDKEGRLYLATFTAGTISRINDFSGAGYTTLNIPVGHYLSAPVAVVVDEQDRIYIVDASGSKIVRVDNMNGDNWTEYGGYGAGMGQFGTPVGIALDSAHRIYVVDDEDNRVVRVDDMSGAGWIELTAMGGQNLSVPYDIAVDSSGGIYVAVAGDRIAYAANMSDTTGASFGTSGSGVGQFTTPSGIALDASGKIYITDTNNSRLVCINNMTGAGWHTYGSIGSGAGYMSYPSHILLR